jgi:hypothetical protein
MTIFRLFWRDLRALNSGLERFLFLLLCFNLMVFSDSSRFLSSSIKLGWQALSGGVQSDFSTKDLQSCTMLSGSVLFSEGVG